MARKFGRLHIPDPRDDDYQVRKCATLRLARYWHPGGWWGDQKNEPSCVGFAWVHWLEDGPITHRKKHPPMIDPQYLYREAQMVDMWPGERYAGTSVRARAKVLQSLGHVIEYRWIHDLETLVNAILAQGPVVMGTNWYVGMMEPEKDGWVRKTGWLLGGHAYVLNGVNIKREKFRIKNSYGRSWGKAGAAFISFDDVEALLLEDGEACLATENPDS